MIGLFVGGFFHVTRCADMLVNMRFWLAGLFAKISILVLNKISISNTLPLLLIPSWAPAIDSFLVSCATSSAMWLPRKRKPLDGYGFLLLGSSIADYVAHDTKKEINSKGPKRNQ